jgi:hypothetical protein
MGTQVHFEIFRRVGAKGGWVMHDVLSNRERAVEMAQDLMASEKATGVKVVKETYNDETGDYLSLKIFEEGHNQVKVEANAEDAPHALPCFKPDDLYSYPARATMARLLVDFLARNKVTITELIHRADLLEKLEATGTLLQHAIQKVAVAQASTTSTPVQQIVKSLNELTTQAFHRVYRDQRKGLFPDPSPEQFGELARSLASNAEASYIFNASLARSLKDAGGWDDKVHLLLIVMSKAPAEEAPRKLVMGAIGAILAELLNGSAALHELMGPAENLAQALRQLIDLFLGKPVNGARAGLVALAAHIAADDLPEAQTALANRILAELKSNKRLCPESMVDELKALRELANKIVMGVGKYLSHDDLVAAFTLRARRLVTQESLSPYINEAASVDEKVDRLLFVEDNVIGVENKRQLAAFIMPVLLSAPFESHFQNPKLPLLARLQKLAQLQGRVLRGGFIDVTKAEIAEKLDALAVQVEARGKLFESVDSRTSSHVEKAQTLLRLAIGGIFTEGKLSGEARTRILSYLSRPGFLSGYLAATKKDGEVPDTEKTMAELIAILGKAGINAETGLKSIAA